MLFDSHIHSEFSFDSNFSYLDVLSSIPKENNKGIILTEHVDFDYPLPDSERVDFNLYFEKYIPHRCNSFFLGVELGIPANYSKENSLLVKNNNFDFVIGSVHSISNDDIYEKFTDTKLSKNDLYKKYFEEMYNSIVEFHDFDALGHIDYICRYTNFKDPEIYVSEFKEELTKIFSFLIKNNIVLELNTRRLNNSLAYSSLLDIYKLYKDLGGQYITLGSDAHNKENLFCNFDLAFRLMKDIGLKNVYFKNRIMQI